VTSTASLELWDTIARDAIAESSIWGDALRPDAEREREPVFSPLTEERFALGLETIYEGYLVHYGAARLFAPGDPDTRSCSATTSTRTASCGSRPAVTSRPSPISPS
jgi:hypothetical protein